MEVVEVCFIIVIVATITEGIGFRRIAGGAEEFAIGVVLIGSNLAAALVHHVHHVALQVGDVIIGLLDTLESVCVVQGIGKSGVIIAEIQGSFYF